MPARRLLASIVDVEISAGLAPDHITGIIYARDLCLWLERIASTPLNGPLPTIIDAIDMEAQREHTRSAGFVNGVLAAAQIVAGRNDPPRQLFNGLWSAGGDVTTRVMKWNAYPGTHKEYRAKLEMVTQDACFLLGDPRTPKKIRIALRDVIQRSEVAISRIPRKQGRASRYYAEAEIKRPAVKTYGKDGYARASGAARHKARLDEGGMDPAEFCAAVIGEAWDKMRGEYPDPHRIGMHYACEALWRASGGAPHADFSSRDEDGEDVRGRSPWRRPCEVAAKRRREQCLYDTYGEMIAKMYFDFP